jgi:Flp pilus assembly protein TadG
MRRQTHSIVDRPAHRRGIILPVVALVIVVLVGFLALAIDVGMMAIAKTQAQQSADLAALTAMRTMNGNSAGNYNQSAATTNAQNVVTYNVILAQGVQSSQLQLTFGSYDYNQTTSTFNANFPPTSGAPETAVAATVTSNSLPGAFSSMLKVQLLPAVTATAQAVHRPRDIGLVMDLSSSMRYGTMLGFDITTATRSTNNPDTLVPTFSHYSSASAGLIGGSSNQTSSYDSYTISPTNTTAANSSYALTYINGFYQNAAYASTLIRAFDSYTSSNGGTTWSAPSSGTPVLPAASYASVPGGDVPLFKSGSTTTYATTVKDVLGITTRSPAWELDGYSNYTNGSLSNAASSPQQSSYTSAPFYGYTQGPGYYGKTFFIWPPDPRQPLPYSGNTLTGTNNTNQFKQFYTDFGYSATDFSTNAIWQTLLGIYSSSSTTPGDHNWPWPNDGGSSLGSYLTTNVYFPGGSRKLTTADPQYQKIMRLYNWNYVVDSLGTTPCDWRVRFFGTNNNTVLFDTNNSWDLKLPQSGPYTINYNEILRWVAESPSPFPTQLRAGCIKYYGSIPTAITGTWPSYGSTDQRFWVEFIDHVLGFRQTSSLVYQDISDMVGYGGDFTWGTIAGTAPPSATQYMSYTDNPQRPNLRYWFSPILMVDYLHNYNMYENAVTNYFVMQAGDSYEAPIYTGRQAFQATINTMENNHPNDWFTLAFYSQPRNSASSTDRFNNVASPMGTNYNYASSALFFPFSTINANGSTNQTEITPYDADPATGLVPSANFMDTPRPKGNTCFAMGLMLCYNQFAVTPTSDSTLRSYVTSTPITFPTGMAGGLGRKGAQKVIIFETDGLANTSATASLVNAGTYNYYQIRYDMNKPNSSEYPSTTATNLNDPTVLSQVYSLIQQLVTSYGTSRNPFRLYTVGFGSVFQGVNASAAQTTLQTMQYYAGTQASASTALPSNQIITGTDAQMSSNMIDTFTKILENGVQIALIK